ncbi:hypothetical protein [Gloeobacter morelensis]|uniref:Uncharacterized protein n=1 Tax=Gloeobacter morelensis MG652769 TaxID=2781736 RepID=A0ABY3PHL7_9CYAN|nr:hypothetical protein [Gloeobacter morelensis]UFP93042.1 hypothetical protein ISF26_14630 [Gloeobacter morelensis MG652769]
MADNPDSELEQVVKLGIDIVGTCAGGSLGLTGGFAAFGMGAVAGTFFGAGVGLAGAELVNAAVVDPLFDIFDGDDQAAPETWQSEADWTGEAESVAGADAGEMPEEDWGEESLAFADEQSEWAAD